MTPQSLAKQAYGARAYPTRTDRGTEYDAIARITHKLRATTEPTSSFGALAEAIHDNNRMWTIFATGVADQDNRLPRDLRAQLFYLAEFALHHGRKVLSDAAPVQPLIDINTAVMRGLRVAEGAR